MELIFFLLPYVNIFLILINLHQLLGTSFGYEHKIIKHLSLVIMVISIFQIWRERKSRFHNSSPRSISILASIIRRIVAHKLWWWKFKDSWHESMASNFLLNQRDFFD